MGIAGAKQPSQFYICTYLQVKALVAQQVDLLVQDEKGLTALHLAAMEGRTGVLEALLTAGGPELLMVKSNIGRVAREYAEFYGHIESEKMLMVAEMDLKHNIMKKQQQQQETEHSCMQIAEEEATTYGPDNSSTVLAREQFKEIAYQVCLITKTASEMQDDVCIQEKFMIEPELLVCGEFELAAKGLHKLLNMNAKEVSRLASAGVAAIEEEVKALGNHHVSKQLDYILHQRAKERSLVVGVQDKGHNGMLLKDFVGHFHARTAELEEEEVVALRLYTTSAFQQIINPLRKQEYIKEGKQHPLPVTITLVAKGVKKLRTINPQTDASTKSNEVWKGVRNVQHADKFAAEGITEVSK